jgi:outer membrane protein OmpA-like peptidoglycan-associated protein
LALGYDREMPRGTPQGRGLFPLRDADATRLLAALACCAFLSLAHGVASASPSARLDQYRPAPRPDDAFGLSSGDVGAHLEYSGELHVDYARDPLVYENIAGRSSTQRIALVRDQAVAHAAIALGLYDRALVYLGLPVDLAMSGTPLGSQPTATGFGAGDLFLGGRYSLYKGDAASVAFQLTLTMPTGEGGSAGRPGVAGDGGMTGHPEVTSEIKAGPLSVLLDVGARWRKDAHFSGTSFTDVLTFGAGVSVPIATDLLRGIAELRGATPLDDVANREGSPLEALFGLKLAVPPGLTFGLGGGFGILRGYGSPGARVVAMVGYDSGKPKQRPKREPVEQTPPEPEPPQAHEAPAPKQVVQPVPPPVARHEPADGDEDGVADDEDHCPFIAGTRDNAGCPNALGYEEHTGEVVLLSPPRFEGDANKPALVANESLESLRAAMLANAELRVHLEAHLPHGGDARKVMEQSVTRAAAIRAWLTTAGVAETRVEAVGCGSNRPRVPDRGSKRKLNERVEVYLVHPLPPAGLRSSLGCTAVPPTAPPAPAAAPPKPEPPPMRAPAAPPAAPAVVAPAAPPPSAKGDSDGDSVPDAKDACPLAPGPASEKGCPESHRVDLAAGRIELRKPIRFDEGGSAIAEHSRSVVVEVAATLKVNPNMKVAIESHAAADAGADASMSLSRKRAAEVKKQLAEQGVAPARLKAYGCGESRPIAPGNVPWGRKKNDRVELHLLDPAPAAGVHSEDGCSPSE